MEKIQIATNLMFTRQLKDTVLGCDSVTVWINPKGNERDRAACRE